MIETMNMSNQCEQEVFIFPTSFSQERLWLLEKLRSEKAIYNILGALKITGNLQIDPLEKAFNTIVERHEILRTTFPLIEGNPVQAITPEITIPVSVVDCQTISATKQLASVKEMMAETGNLSFDLENGPLLRITLFKLNETSHILMVSMHHIIADGWSMGIMIRELSMLYRAYSHHLEPSLPELTIQYADFAEWQRQRLSGDTLETQLSYWREQLRDAPPMIALPTDHSRPTVQSFRGSHHTITLPTNLVNSLTSFSHQQGVTLFTTLLTGLKILLYRWTGQRDLVVGTVIAGRNQPEIEPLIGCFMNFLALRSRLVPEETTTTLIKQLSQTVIRGYSHQDCPFEKVVEALNPSRDTSHNPIYNVGLLLQNFPLDLNFGEGLDTDLLSVDTQSSLLDLRFEVSEIKGKMFIKCEYNTDLFEKETIELLVKAYHGILDKMTHDPQRKLVDFTLPEKLQIQSKTQPQTLAIAATFTAELLEHSLKFWLKELDLSAKIQWVAYNQVFQALLNPNSEFELNQNGLNVILIRLEDWAGKKTEITLNNLQLQKTIKELGDALITARQRSKTPYLVCLCPPSPHWIKSREDEENYQRFEQRIAENLMELNGVHLILSSQLAETYPVINYYDADSEMLGHIPYTQTFFSGLGTMIMRRFYALQRPPYKVIVVDCDQTLWKGVCGEDGAMNVTTDSPYRFFQEFLIQQKEQGKLLCLCSKNEEQDVLEVFNSNPSMVLKLEDLVTWRINWQSKSENLKSLAKELKLGLDSFIFIDDNPVECAEVKANCPEVLTLQLPQDEQQIPRFLQHNWVFDNLKVTTEDQKRTTMYRQNLQREQLREKTLTFEGFLAGLQLDIKIKPALSSEISRIAQLSQRTNQFNFTTKRRTEGEIQQLLSAKEAEILTVQVSDRFGDYGLVGVIIFKNISDALMVDTFLLSCRTLGRGVEHQMLAKLGEIAQNNRCQLVQVPFIISEKNQPAYDFLNSVTAKQKEKIDQGWLFKFESEKLATLKFQPHQEQETVIQTSSSSSSINYSARESSKLYQRIATELGGDVNAICEAINRQTQWKERRIEETFVAPRNPVEETIADMWREVLKIDKVGIYDNFFALGGSSLLGVQIVNRLRQRFQVELPLIKLFEEPTIAGIGKCITELSTDLMNTEDREEIEF